MIKPVFSSAQKYRLHATKILESGDDLHELTGRRDSAMTAKRVHNVSTALKDLSELHAKSLLDRTESLQNTSISHQPPKALDVGMGDGSFIPMLSKYAKTVVGTLPSNEEIQAAQFAIHKPAIHIKAYVNSLPFGDSQFGLVLVNSVLHGVGFRRRSFTAALKEVARVLGRGGVLVIGEMPQHRESPPAIKSIWKFAVQFVRSSQPVTHRRRLRTVSLRSSFYMNVVEIERLALENGLRLAQVRHSDDNRVISSKNSPDSGRLDYYFVKS